MSAPAQLETASPRTWDELEASPQWHRLSSQQKAWVVIHITTGDPVQATSFAYRCSSPKNARCLSYEIRKSEAVVDALNFWNGKSERDLMLEHAQENLRNSEPGSIAASKFLAMCIQLGGLTRPAATPAAGDCGTFDPEPTRFKVGDICTQDGTNYRVTKLDAVGKILEAEEIE